jgi:hypothetical protein
MHIQGSLMTSNINVLNGSLPKNPDGIQKLGMEVITA